jgi:uncharacterized protein
MMAPPRSRMDVLEEKEIDTIITQSKIVTKYNEPVDSESAYEILTAKLEEAAEKTAEAEQEQEAEKKEKKEGGFFDNPMVKQVGRTAASVITRGLLGALGLGGRSRGRSKKKSNSWF